MTWNRSEVISEFFKIASDTNLLSKAAYPPNPFQESLKTIEEKFAKDPEKSIVEIAHPEPAYIAESQGDGGLVENDLEAQQKAKEIVNKMPNGNLPGRYANVIGTLVKLADQCDALNEKQAADLLTKAAAKLVSHLEDKELLF